MAIKKIILIMIGDWGLGIGPNPQSPIPNPQSPILFNNNYNYIHNNINKYKIKLIFIINILIINLINH